MHVDRIKAVSCVDTSYRVKVNSRALSSAACSCVSSRDQLHGEEMTEHTSRSRDGAGEMTQRLRALTALPENWGSIPRTHLAAHNCL